MTPAALAVRRGPKPVSVAEFRDALEALRRPRLPPARHVRPRPLALAVSGGVDSMAMAFLFASLFQAHPHCAVADHAARGACAVVVDHQLRPASDREAACVADELRRLGLRARVERLDWRPVTRQGLHPARLSNLESVARTLRYRALGSACRSLQADSLFFAHHRDDQYETVLMRLPAGHGYRGLRGIREANAIPECYELHGVYKSGHRAQPSCSASHRSASLDCEHGGVVVYRPLLAFDKARLVATCEANKVRWFDDDTNLDPTLTTRNAIRHLTHAHPLPAALQKPAILSLRDRANRRTASEEAEGHRLLVREAVVRHFDPGAGTLTVQLPSFGLRRLLPRRLHAAARYEVRKRRRRLVLAIALRKLIDFVTPELHLPPLAGLENVVDRLFPESCAEPSRQASSAFSAAGVLFAPVAGPEPNKWLLSRAPFPSSRPLPGRRLRSPKHRPDDVSEEPATIRRARWRSWETPQLWDGRFWIRLGARVPVTIRLLPLMPEHAKAFRRALPRPERGRLERVLKRRAPGKVRYALPALYAAQEAGPDEGTPDTLTLLALPSLGFHVPGLERWARYEVKYKSIDQSLLGLTRRDGARLRLGCGRSRRKPCRILRRAR